MQNKMPEAGQRYRHKESGWKVTVLRVVNGTDFIIYEVDFLGQCGVDKHRFLEIFEELQEENKKLKSVITVVNYCLSDYVVTEHGIKIVNSKDLDDAQDLLKETVAEFKKQL